jgi:uncharacterized protein (TIGR00266 family)
MADEIDYQIMGDDMQIVEIELDPEEAVQAEAGAMAYMGPGIQMQTSMGNEGGGLFGSLKKGLKRVLAGESFFITSFIHKGSGKGHVAFAAPYPGKIIPIDLTKFGGSLLCQKDSFLCAARGVEIEVAFTRKLGAGLFGGEGFILQRLKGDGLAFLHIGGTVIRKDLAPGETYRVDTGCVAAFTETVTYDIPGQGILKMLSSAVKELSLQPLQVRAQYICRACLSPASLTGSLQLLPTVATGKNRAAYLEVMSLEA